MLYKTQLATLAVLVGPTVALTAYAEVYLSDIQAADVLFPQQVFKKETVELSDEEVKSIATHTKKRVKAKKLAVLKAKSGDLVFVDQVFGKHEFITYAVGIKKDGRIQGIEILEYRESYGHQIRREEWRKQFVNKDKSSPLEFDKDIKNISGATISCSHVTEGVQRVLATYEQIKSRL
jgi:Na+-translocating ferredoxin:NAD+ oxidoreductase RnfG subunit